MFNKLACAAAAALLFTSTAHAGDYSIRDLTGYGSDIRWDHLNNAGDVAGYGNWTVYVRGTTNTSYVIEGFDISSVTPTALGNNGTVYATSSYYNGGGLARSIAADGTVSLLPRLPQTGSNPNRSADFVNAVNNQGVAVGSGSNGNGTCIDHCEFFIGHSRAVIYQNGQVTDIGTFGGNEASANSINNQGAVVGWAHAASGRRDAYIYADGQMTLLRENSEALSINDAGVVAGISQHVDANWNRWETAFVYQNGAFTDLAMEGYRSTGVVDMNNAGQVLGYAERFDSGRDYFLYDDGETTFLKDLLALQEGSAGWDAGSAIDINDKGEILIDVYRSNGEPYSQRFWVLTPVPEPGTWAMLLAGFGAIGIVARRRKAHS